ncbi:TetR/AcrR family transcriptional regulator [Pedobacter cryophilus]|uniref:TetR/AcrR family transcriptional regulator n=1 Tax=Pedobacter cryophilus TaxID=2571271 RepID=A0A4U1BV26_9SPHI|nr:TetR/AcrR family transcriptional regulator [Pedobacter cryophilus]TKB96195.1 TetR/AcrR family transcriptional regulator [Pedobacter cryophilus]
MIEQVDIKQEQIIEVALKRFSHFGVSKTTMNEIADDLSFSKALLYYYFPDKTTLVLKVIEHIFYDFINKQNSILAGQTSLKLALSSLIDLKIEFGKKYFMLHMNDGQTDHYLTDARFRSLLDKTKEEELNILFKLFSRFKSLGLIKDIDCKDTAQIFIDVLTGLWVFEVHINLKTLIPTEEQFLSIKTKYEKLITIFYDGIIAR